MKVFLVERGKVTHTQALPICVSCLWMGEVKVKSLSRVWLFATPWTVAYQAPPSMGFSRQECWSRLPFPSPGDLPNPGIEPWSPTLQADASPSEPPGKPHGYSQFHKTDSARGSGVCFKTQMFYTQWVGSRKLLCLTYQRSFVLRKL